MGDCCPSLHACLARLLDDLCQYRHSPPCRCSAAAVHDLTIWPIGCRSRPIAVHADEAFPCKSSALRTSKIPKGSASRPTMGCAERAPLRGSYLPALRAALITADIAADR